MQYYDVEDLANMFHVHPATIKKEVQRSKLECFRVGSEFRFTQEHVDQYTNVIKFGKTTREIELEKIIEEKDMQLRKKDEFIENVKNGLLELS